MRRLLAFLLLFVCAPALAQSPDRRGEVAIDVPQYKGYWANVPIPTEMHFRNEGGSDGSGLCVIASTVINGHMQGVPDLDQGKGSALWRAAKGLPGGYGPDKLAHLVEQIMPGELYASYTGTDTGVLETLSAKGYPIGATMNTGALYDYAPIHHMISLVHYNKSQNLACVVDNNDPGKYHWMPATEFDKRWVDQGSGWAWIWTRINRKILSGLFAPAVLFAAALIIVCAAIQRTDASPSPEQVDYEL